MSSPIKITLIDDDPIYREGLKNLLIQFSDIEVIGSYCNSAEFFAESTIDAIEIAILDIDLPTVNGIEIAKRLAQQNPEIKILFLTALQHEEYAYSSFGKNIFGMLTKTTSVSQLVAAIKQVNDGFTVISSAPAALLSQVTQNQGKTRDFDHFRKNVEALPEYLKPVFYELVEAHSNKEISRNLSLSEATVRSYVSEIFLHLNITNRAQLAVTAIRAGY